MRIFHLADLHLGKSIYERELIADQEYVLEQVLEHGRREKPAAVVMAGDIFDRAVPSSDAVKLLGKFVAGLKAIEPSPVIIIIPGNHDSPARLSFMSEILDTAGVHIRANPADCIHPLRVPGDDCGARFWLLPYLSPGSLAGLLSETADSATNGQGAGPALIRSQAELFARALALMGPALEAERAADKAKNLSGVDILVSHSFAQGGHAGDTERPFIGTAELVDISQARSFDYVALGHLHRAQAAGKNAWYPGSLLAYSFADSGSERGLIMAEVQPGKLKIGQLPLLPLHRMSSIEGQWDELIKPENFTEYSDDYLEVYLKDHLPVLNPVDTLRRKFPFVLSVRQAAFERPASLTESKIHGEKVNGASRSLMDEFAEFFSFINEREAEEEDREIFASLYKAAEKRFSEGDAE